MVDGEAKTNTLAPSPTARPVKPERLTGDEANGKLIWKDFSQIVVKRRRLRWRGHVMKAEVNALPRIANAYDKQVITRKVEQRRNLHLLSDSK